MKRVKKMKLGLIVLSVSAILFVSCNNEDTQTLEVNTDVIFKHKIIDNDTVTGSAYYAYGNQGLSEATVTIPNDGGVVELEQYPNSTYTFYKEPAEEDYTTEEPSTGSYLFSGMSNNSEPFEISDTQELDYIGFAVLDSTSFDQEQNFYFFKWQEVEGAQSYVAVLLDSEGEIIFNSYPIDDSTPNYYISTQFDSGTWESQPENGETYTLRIQSYIYDADATNNDYVYNIQEISMADYSLVWELN